MNILRLQILVLLDRLKKVTAVAEELGVKQPTVSFHMKKLEEEWGTPLFEMKTGKVLLTEAGRLLCHYAAGIDQLYREAEARFAVLEQTGKHQFVIGCTDCAAAILFDDDWYARVTEAVEVQIKLVTGSSSELLAKLRDGTVDLIVNGGLLTPLTQNDSVPLLEEMLNERPLAIYMAESHPLAKSAAIPSYRLAALPFVKLEDSELEEALLDWESHEKVNLTLTLSTDRIQHSLSAVRSGSLVAILPALKSSQLPKGIVQIPLTGAQKPYPLTAIWRSDYWNPALLQRLSGLMKELLAK
ncbi:LysR family transcriptional regulator [Paenibacillus sp. OV219]|uniref:LysR family transcriptional regulator n=1 Tax=Paenibacillus sp. OV219 TaxID=1884377 RepID=UPI0008D4482E|nr:LysR family transcriptional regulator [Paenibacillus sp. OV219]SEM61622.1 transcriptional regulator, LysR family [Paenibacillus sp. OV219]